jgi:hypothetical protein
LTDSLKKAAYVAVPLLCLGLGAAGGWYAKPDVYRIEEKVKVETVEKQVVVVQEKVRVEKVYIKDVQVVERWHREKTEEKKPDGTVLTKEVEDRNIDSILKETRKDVEVKIVEVEKQVVVKQEVEKRVTMDPVLSKWRGKLMVGVAPTLPNIVESPLMFGVEGEMRVAGPLWLGLWAMGGSPVTRFSLSNVSGGISVGAEW